MSLWDKEVGIQNVNLNEMLAYNLISWLVIIVLWHSPVFTLTTCSTHPHTSLMQVLPIEVA